MAYGYNEAAELASYLYTAEEWLQLQSIDGYPDGWPQFKDKHNTWVDERAKIGARTIIFPGCVIMGEKTNIGKHCVIWPNTIIINIKTGDNVTLGLPILKDSQLDDGSATGATAELNRAKLGRRVKDFHHSYLGDAEVGDDSNIGAGTITANYDGINKNKTVLGPGTFTGINSNIIAPNELPEGSYIAAGATVTKNLKERRRLPPFSLIFSLLQLDIRPRKDREPQNA